MVKNIKNPFNIGETGGFKIETSYEGLSMDSTYLLKTDSRTVNATASADNIMAYWIKFNPRNEGERAVY